jgi:hypothetical protein
MRFTIDSQKVSLGDLISSIRITIDSWKLQPGDPTSSIRFTIDLQTETSAGRSDQLDPIRDRFYRNFRLGIQNARCYSPLIYRKLQLGRSGKLSIRSTVDCTETSAWGSEKARCHSRSIWQKLQLGGIGSDEFRDPNRHGFCRNFSLGESDNFDPVTSIPVTSIQ